MHPLSADSAHVVTELIQAEIDANGADIAVARARETARARPARAV